MGRATVYLDYNIITKKIMPTSLIASVIVFVGSIGFFAVANAQTKNSTPVSEYKAEKSVGTAAIAMSASDYYLQSWNCLTNL